MLEHTLTSHTLYFLYLAHSLATVTRQALSFQLLAHPFCRHRTKRSSLLSIVSGLFSVARRVSSLPRKKLPAQRLISGGWKDRNPRRRGRLREDRSGRSRNRS